MSVYTKVTAQELTEFLREYTLGELTHFSGIQDGIENTNYFVTTSRGEFVLTLFEVLTGNDLPYFLDLMAFLAEHDIPSAHPVANNNRQFLGILNGKPAALVMKLKGQSVLIPDTGHCSAIGKVMGRMHKASLQFDGNRKMERGPAWWQNTAEAVLPKLADEEGDLLRNELKYQSSNLYRDLPVGVIHADLFRDNALFMNHTLTGIIDFYYACNSYFIYDLAVTVNDWCNDKDADRNLKNAHSLLYAYQQERSVTGAEVEAWPTMLRAAALRFWLSRLQDKYFPRRGELTHIKDPDVFRDILYKRVNDREQAVAMWDTGYLKTASAG